MKKIVVSSKGITHTLHLLLHLEYCVWHSTSIAFEVPIGLFARHLLGCNFRNRVWDQGVYRRRRALFQLLMNITHTCRNFFFEKKKKRAFARCFPNFDMYTLANWDASRGCHAVRVFSVTRPLFPTSHELCTCRLQQLTITCVGTYYHRPFFVFCLVRRYRPRLSLDLKRAS